MRPFGSSDGEAVLRQRRARDGGACAGQYAFEGVAPGMYEVYATTAHGVSAGFIELTLDRDTESASVSANGASAGGAHNAPPEFQCSRKHSRESQRPAAGPVGSRSRTRYRDAKNHVAPGRWELKGARVQANSSSPSSIRASARVVPRSIHTPTGSMFSSKRDLYAQVWITVSDRAGRMSGRVTADGSPVLGIPVFLWPVGETTRRSLGGPKQLLSSTAGRFEFPDLPPGDYRLLATFDLSEVDEETLDGARAVAVHVDPSQAATADLSPWIAP